MENSKPDEPQQQASASSRNICNACGCKFTPSFRHSHQKYCMSPQCMRDRNAVRKKQNTKLHLKDADYRKRTSRRKHDEYERRKTSSRHPRAPESVPPPSCDPVVTALNLDVYFMGLISYATGTKSASDLTRLLDHCYEIGKNICLGV